MSLTIVIFVLIFWFFIGWLAEMMIKEEEEKRIKYDMSERYKLK